MNQNICLCPAHVPDTLLLGISWELCSKYIWVCFLIRIDVKFYLSSGIVVQMLGWALCIDQEVNILSCFICQPQYICWCSLGKQLSVWMELPSVLCFALAYVSGSYYNTLSNHEESHSQLYNDMLEFTALHKNSAHTPPQPRSPHIKARKTENFIVNRLQNKEIIWKDLLGFFFSIPRDWKKNISLLPSITC